MRTKTMMIALVCFGFIQILNSCDPDSCYYDYRLKVLNKSSKSIYADFYQSYPDTTLSMISHFENDSKKAAPGKTVVLVRGGTWENAFKEDINQKLVIFVFDANVIENTAWGTVRKDYLVLKRYELTLKELQVMNWEVKYE